MARQFTAAPGDNIHQSVLIVDDEPMARTLLRLMLVRAGFHVSEAEDGYDALDKVRKNQPDVVLLDVMMPGMDGFTVCEKIRSEAVTAELPIIMLSAKTDLDSINKGLRAGATVYLTKPISPEELTQHVQDALIQFDEDVSDPGSVEAT
ncbi:response regulator [Candidatus Leptofilum sp.]|uniref:response regulator n=1 Tax=Candidatus Leptofilum sp. TaxID=3241576 RepID=UPI003B5C9760